MHIRAFLEIEPEVHAALIAVGESVTLRSVVGAEPELKVLLFRGYFDPRTPCRNGIDSRRDWLIEIEGARVAEVSGAEVAAKGEHRVGSLKRTEAQAAYLEMDLLIGEGLAPVELIEPYGRLLPSCVRGEEGAYRVLNIRTHVPRGRHLDLGALQRCQGFELVVDLEHGPTLSRPALADPTADDLLRNEVLEPPESEPDLVVEMFALPVPIARPGTLPWERPVGHGGRHEGAHVGQREQTQGDEQSHDSDATFSWWGLTSGS